jgi:hypothetical protein
MFVKYIMTNNIVNMNGIYHYTIIDTDFEHTIEIDFNDCKTDATGKNAQVKFFDAVMNMYEERNLNVAINAIYAIKWLDGYWKAGKNLLLPLLKEHSKMYKKYENDIEKYMMLV